MSLYNVSLRARQASFDVLDTERQQILVELFRFNLIVDMVSFVIVKFLLVTVLPRLKFVHSDILLTDANSNYADCTGSLVITTNRRGNELEKRFSESNNRTRLDASSIRVEGCGCFDLYKRQYFKSTSARITHHMTMGRQNITVGFKIRSIEKVSCEATMKSLGDEGWSVWMIVCIVTGLSLSIMVVVGFKCYRKYIALPPLA